MYFARATGTDLVKIGLTRGEVGRRIALLQVGCPHMLFVEAELEADDAALLEESLHRICRARLVGGEWYRVPAGELASVVERGRQRYRRRQRTRGQGSGAVRGMLTIPAADMVQSGLNILARQMLFVADFARRADVDDRTRALLREVEHMGRRLMERRTDGGS